jgi:hypothetical protein
MTDANVTKYRGTIIKVPDATPGILLANGQQQFFTLERVWKSPVAPVVNQTVDVEIDGAGAIAAITVVDSQQVNKERLNQLSGVAQERGKEAAKLAQKGIGALAARMGTVALAAGVVLLIMWFFIPAASVGGEGMGSVSLTFWGLLGTDFNNPQSILSGGADHGLFAIIGLIAIAAPFTAPFVRASWSKYLNAAPLVYFVVAFLMIYMNENKAFGDLVKLGAPNPFSWSWLIVLLMGITTLVLASGALKNPANA